MKKIEKAGSRLLFMYNYKTFEYRRVSAYDYKNYNKNANHLLKEISEWSSVPVIDLSCREVIEFFLNSFPIDIIYFDNTDRIKRKINGFEPLISLEVSETYLKRVSGFTMTDGNYFKIFLQQFYCAERIIFTLLHELVHIYFHCNQGEYMQIFASLQSDEDYPESIVPFEDEANIIASILNLNDERLVKYLDDGCSFDMIVNRHGLSKTALHNRLNNYLMYNIGLNPNTALYDYLLPYKHEVFGTKALKDIQLLLNVPKNFFILLSNVNWKGAE